LAQKKLSELDRTITLRREQGLEAALEVALADEGHRIMDQIREASSAMTGEKEERLRLLNLETARRATHSQAVTVGGSLLGAVLLGAVIASLRREISQRRQAEAAAVAKQGVLTALIEGTSDNVFMKDREGRYLLLNSTCARVLGKKPEEILGKDDLAFMSPESAQGPMQSDREVMNTGRPFSYEYPILMAGERRILQATKSPLYDGQGRIIGVIGISRDVTERKQAEERRLRELALLNELGEFLQSCLNIEEAYDILEKKMGSLLPESSGLAAVMFPSRNLVEVKASWGASPPIPNRGVFVPEECWALRSGRPYFQGGQGSGPSCRHFSEKPVRWRFCIPLASQSETLGVMALESEDPSGAAPAELPEDRKRYCTTVAGQIGLALANLRLRETLRNQSIRDPLTGLYNRRYLEEMLEREINLSGRTKAPIGVIMIDIDFFKKLNDTFGHEAGDTALRSLGGLLRSQVRGSDHACRYGGEELCVILPNATLEDTVRRAEVIREGARSMDLVHQGRSIGRLTLSLGVCAFPTHGTTGEELLSAADLALYKAKKDGRDRVQAAPLPPVAL
jgi:diguanylate cyclase (GGDEF)-like protein/PAS domain S-box-containing protein